MNNNYIKKNKKNPSLKNISEVMRWIGSHKSLKKAKASRENGKLGGRPKKKK